MPRLLVEKWFEKGKVISITGTQAIIIGREPTAFLCISDPLASRQHCRVERRGADFAVVDLNSRNGTIINGKPVREQMLNIGDCIRIGETMISLLAEEIDGKKDALVGQTIKGYRIIERVGRGGMGTVYKAEQLSLRRTVALKILAQELVKDRSFIHLFIQEARAAAQLNHPNIVQVYDIDREADTFYFSMEFVPNGSVQDLLAREKFLTPKAAVPILVHAARGLEYAERKQIVHRDIKPDNLFVGEDGVVKIGDLGLARSIAEQPAEGREGTIFGTPHFIAPEQALGKQVDHRADIYALGASAYRMLAGTTPYSGTTIREIILKKLKEPPPPLKSLAPSVPDSLATLVERMMNKAPEERPQSATALLDELGKISGELAGSGTSKYGAPIALTTDALPKLRRLPLILGVVAAVLILLGGGAFALWKFVLEKKPTPPPDNGETVVNPPPNHIEPNPGDSKYLERLAEKHREDAQKAEGAMQPNDVAALDNVIALYEKIISESPGTVLTAAVEQKIADLKQQRREIAARKAFKEIEARMEAFKTKFPETLDIAPYAQLTTELENLRKEFEDTETAEAPVDDALRGLAAWREEVNRILPALDRMRKETGEALAENNYRRAAVCLVAFAMEYKENVFTPAVREIGEKVRVEIDLYFGKTLQQARNLKDQKRFDEAISILEKALAQFGLEDAPDKKLLEIALDRFALHQVIGKIEGAIGEMEKAADLDRIAAERDKIAKERKAFFDARQEVAKHLETYAFADAERALRTTLAELTLDEFRAPLEIDAAIFARAEAIRLALVNRANGANGGLKDPSIEIENLGKAKVVGAVETRKEKGLKIEMEGGKATLVRKWDLKELHPNALFFLIRQGWDLTLEETVNLCAFCVVMSDVDSSLRGKAKPLLDECLKRAIGAKNAELEKAIRQLMKRL